MNTRIEKYLSGELSGAERNALEKEALNDPFLADALEGLEHSENAELVKETQTSFENKFFGGKSGFAFKGAIGIGVIALLAGAFFFMNRENEEVLPNSQVVIEESIPSDTPKSSRPKISSIPEEKAQPIKEEIIVKKNSVMVINEEEIPENKFELNETITPIKTIEAEQIKDSTVQTSIGTKLKRIRGSNMNLEYFFHLKVVDYSTIYRTSIRVDKTLNQGTPAYMENQETDNGMTINFDESNWVPYMEYLEGTMKHISKGRNKLALKNFAIIFGNFPEDANAQFYGGLSNFYLKRYDEAIVLFDAVVENETNTFHEEANWHRLLCYKATGQKVLFEMLKKDIVGLEGFYAERAKGTEFN